MAAPMTPAEFKAGRKSLGLTQQALADELGLDPSTVRRYEAEGTRTAQPVPRVAAWAMRGLLLSRVLSPKHHAPPS